MKTVMKLNVLFQKYITRSTEIELRIPGVSLSVLFFLPGFFCLHFYNMFFNHK